MTTTELATEVHALSARFTQDGTDSQLVAGTLQVLAGVLLADEDVKTRFGLAILRFELAERERVKRICGKPIGGHA